MRFWFDAQLREIFGVTVRPSAETADQIYDQIAECLDSPEFKPRALYARFGIEVLATTDDPCDDLSAHQFLRDDPTWTGRVIPTFRPDKYLEAASPTWNADVDRLAEVSGIDTGDYTGYIAAMENRRRYFKDNGRRVVGPQPRRRPHRRAGDVRGGADLCARSPGGRSPTPRPPRFGGTWCRRWPGWPATTAW